MSSPTDWYDTIDQQEYIGDAHLSKNTDEPNTGSENMEHTNITDQRAMEAFNHVTGIDPELPAVIEWVKQTLTDFRMPFTAQDDQDEVMDFIADWANTEAERNTYYLNALIAADAGIWTTELLDKYNFGTGQSGYLQMDEVHTAFVYEIVVAMALAYIDTVAKGAVA